MWEEQRTSNALPTTLLSRPSFPWPASLVHPNGTQLLSLIRTMLNY